MSLNRYAERARRRADNPTNRSNSAFMRWAADVIRKNPEHPLRFLLSPRENTEGQLVGASGRTLAAGEPPYLDWNQFTRRTKTGNLQRGRYPLPRELVPSKHSDDRRKFTVQAGHRLARAAHGKERYMLEDADLNHISGYAIEAIEAPAPG